MFTKIVRLAITAGFSTLLVGERMLFLAVNLGGNSITRNNMSTRQVRMLRAVGIDLIEMAEEIRASDVDYEESDAR